MSNIDVSEQIRIDKKANVIYITFSGHISKTEMSRIISQINTLIDDPSFQGVNALHNLAHVSHITIDAQILFAEHARSKQYRKHALVTADTRIQESIDVIIAIAEEQNGRMKIFSSEDVALSWLLQ